MPTINAILEINGQRYESHSGVWLAENQASKARAKSIDGMIAPAGAHFDGLASSPREQALHNIVTKPTMNDVVRAGENPLHKKPQPSMILMRTAVKKPELKHVKRLKAQSAVSKVPAKRPEHKLQAKISVASLDHVRARRAETSAKSEKVTKFSKHSPANHQLPETLTPTIKQLTPAVHHKNQHHTPKHRTTSDIFEEALAHAKGHHEAPHHPKKRRAHKRPGVIAASIAAFVALSGFAVAQNVDNMKMYLASSKAGFAATAPGYEPAGYHMEKVSSGAGMVAANYISNTDNRSYTLTQKPSKWDSPTLLDEYVKPNSSGAGNYYSVEKNGKTIYIFGDRHATWVSGGVWYDVKATDDLSDRQLIDIAVSL